jgi:hypothetical protein
MRNFFCLVICSGAAAVAIAGCGGGDDSSSTTVSTGASGASGVAGATPLSEDEFVSQANSICADANGQIEALSAPSNDLHSVAEFTSDGIAILKPAVQQLQALVPPADLQDQYSQWLTAVQKAFNEQQQLQSAAESGDGQTVQSLADDIQGHNDANNQLASDLGLTECARDVQPQG